MISRRTLFTAPAVALTALVWHVRAAKAHEGHDLQSVHALVLATERTPEGFWLSLELTNGGTAATHLTGIYAEFGTAQADLPMPLAPGQRTHLSAFLPGETVPGIFTLILDFGEDGSGPVLVVPD